MAIGDITLTSAMRANLVSLQSTEMLLGRTQERLSTGKRVNSAIDNPTNWPEQINTSFSKERFPELKVTRLLEMMKFSSFQK